MGFDLAVIPAGLTCMCQPLDIVINKQFKDNLRKEWHVWMGKGGASETATGNLHHALIVMYALGLRIRGKEFLTK